MTAVSEITDSVDHGSMGDALIFKYLAEELCDDTRVEALVKFSAS